MNNEVNSNIIRFLRYLLLPFSLMYGGVMALRNLFYRYGVFCSHSFPFPVINVGNISVGGTGKTPHTEYLIKLLKDQFEVGVLSRGYMRQSRGFMEVLPDTLVELSGDEPLQIKQKFEAVHVAVDEDRVHGIHKLKEKFQQLQVVLLDDAFQHRRVKPGFNILLIDFYRPIKKDLVMPAGNLREFPIGRRRADIIIITKCPNLFEHEMLTWREKYLVHKNQKMFFSTFAYSSPKVLFGGALEISMDDLKETDVLLVTGIANADPLKNYVESHCRQVKHLNYADHQKFTQKDVDYIMHQYQGIKNEKKVVITTEKDSMKLKDFATLQNKLRNNLFYLPIEVKILFGQNHELKETILNYVRQNQ